MSKPSKKAPELRFKGFSDAWEQRKLGEITLKVGSGKTPRGGKSSYVLKGIAFLRSQNVYDDLICLNDVAYITSQTDEEMKNSRVVKNDVLLNITGASIGRSAVYRYSKSANVNQHVCIIRPCEDHSSDFIQLNLTSPIGQQQIDSNQAGGGREGLNFKQIGEMNFAFPSIEEQQKIGEFFRELDNLITLHQRKLDTLKRLKEAYLQNMFPTNRESVPKLRFADFEEEWEQRKVREIFNVTRGQVLAATETSENKSDEMPYPVYSSQTKNNGLMGFYKDYLFDTAITWTTDGANAGTVNYRDGKFYSTNVNGVLLSREGYANKAVAEALNSVAWKYVSRVGNPKLMNNTMSDIVISLPLAIKEQNEVSKFLDNIDHLITLHENKLEQFQQLKQAYLQKMFI